MDKYELFKEYTAKVAERFKQLDKKETVRLISHLDCDGIAACSIMVKALNQLGMRYSISIVKNLSAELINELSKENYRYVIFTDLGSGQMDLLKGKLDDRTILILDHHIPSSEEKMDNILHVNPHLFGIDGSKEISGAGVVYTFAKALDPRNEDMAHIGVIGALGDVQESNGFMAMNDEILQTAIQKKKIKVSRGPRLFGIQTRALHKILQYSTDPFIPGVSGSESGAIQFLQSVGINPKASDGWRKYVHLTENEVQKLVAGIVMRRKGEDKPEDVLGAIYTLLEEEKESPLRDAREFATLLNACGRLGKASLGIGTCLNDEKIKKHALTHMLKYKKEIVTSLNWYNNNKNSKDILSEDGILIINARDNIMPTMIGTVASIISKSNDLREYTYILSLARDVDGTTKVSLRISGQRSRKDIDLRSLITEIVQTVGGESGGHHQAAGALIDSRKEDEFVTAAIEVLRRKIIEEKS